MTKPSTPYNDLSPAEAERLALLSEECGEVVQIIGKILRHGYESCHPDDGTRTNRRLLEKELGDVSCARAIMVSAGDINQITINELGSEKMHRVKHYLHHNPNIMSGKHD